MEAKVKIEGPEYLRPKEAMAILRCKSHRILWRRLKELGVNIKWVNTRVALIKREDLERALNNSFK